LRVQVLEKLAELSFLQLERTKNYWSKDHEFDLTIDNKKEKLSLPL
jgi:hypothetical protein